MRHIFSTASAAIGTNDTFSTEVPIESTAEELQRRQTRVISTVNDHTKALMRLEYKLEGVARGQRATVEQLENIAATQCNLCARIVRIEGELAALRAHSSRPPRASAQEAAAGAACAAADAQHQSRRRRRRQQRRRRRPSCCRRQARHCRKYAQPQAAAAEEAAAAARASTALASVSAPDALRRRGRIRIGRKLQRPEAALPLNIHPHQGAWFGWQGGARSGRGRERGLTAARARSAHRRRCTRGTDRRVAKGRMISPNILCWGRNVEMAVGETRWTGKYHSLDEGKRLV
jgi:hypothetical protein